MLSVNRIVSVRWGDALVPFSWSAVPSLGITFQEECRSADDD